MKHPWTVWKRTFPDNPKCYAFMACYLLFAGTLYLNEHPEVVKGVGLFIGAAFVLRLCLRVIPTKNKQTKGIVNADDFLKVP